MTTASRISAWARLWLAAGGIAVGVTLSLLAVWPPERTPADPLEAMITASAHERFIEPRLTGGFRYAPKAPTRGQGQSSRASGAEADIAAARAQQLVSRDPSAHNLAAFGKALLLSGRVDEAVARLEEAVRADPRPPHVSDLSAAYLVRSAASGNHADAVRALDAALKAVRRAPSLPEAQFNVALAFEATQLHERADTAWKQYAALDGASGWATEARHRLDTPDRGEPWDRLRARLLDLDLELRPEEAVRRFPQHVSEVIEDELLPSWAAGGAPVQPRQCRVWERAVALARALAAQGADRMPSDVVAAVSTHAECPHPTEPLAGGLAVYRTARQQLAAGAYADAAKAFDAGAARLRMARNPLAYRAVAHLAFARHQTQDMAGARDAAHEAEQFARSRSYASLRARALFLGALVLLYEGHPDEALRLCAESIALYEHVHEAGHARATASSAADIARNIGHHAESWRLMTRALATVRDEPVPVRRYLTFYNAALFARQDQLFDAALALQDEAVRAAHDCAQLGALVQALGHRAFLELRTGRRDAALQDLARARQELVALRAGTAPYMAAELDTIEAAAVLDDAPNRARTLLLQAVDVFDRTAPHKVSDAHFAIGRASLVEGNTAAAAAAFMKGIEIFESRRRRIADEDLRISFFGTARDLYSAMIRLRLDQGDAEGAFLVADRVRARALVDLLERQPVGMTAMLSEERLRDVLGVDAAFVAFLLLDNEVVIWTLGREGLSLVRSPADATTLERCVRTIRSRDAPADAERECAAQLYDTLVRPIESRLAAVRALFISFDGVLHDLPLAQLLDRRTNRRLVELYSTTVVPSASWLALRKGRPGAARRQILAIGDPAFDRSRHRGLQPLPAAAREATAVASMYESSDVLLGAAATRAEVLRRMPSADVIHFAGHAVQNAVAPQLSYLLVAPQSESDDGRLHASDLARADLTGSTLVILAACSTAHGTVRYGEGALNLARPFLAAGAASVIASLWDVDDAQTARLLTRVHHGLRAGLGPAEALRQAQLEMRHSSDAAERHPAHWAAFTHIGGTPPESNTRSRREGTQ